MSEHGKRGFGASRYGEVRKSGGVRARFSGQRHLYPPYAQLSGLWPPLSLLQFHSQVSKRMNHRFRSRDPERLVQSLAVGVRGSAEGTLLPYGRLP